MAGVDKGVGKFGRGDLRGLLIQSAQNALIQRDSPLHKWGGGLLIKKHRNQAAVTVARKLTVSISNLLMGHFTPLVEATEHLHVTLLKLATSIGKDGLASIGFAYREAFVIAQIKSIPLST